MAGTIGVYAIICLENRKIYIGQSTNMKKRWSNHRYKLKRNEHYATRLQSAWNKYGEDSFRFFVIEQTTKAKAYERELYWIKKLKPYKPTNGFNRHWKDC